VLTLALTVGDALGIVAISGSIGGEFRD